MGIRVQHSKTSPKTRRNKDCLKKQVAEFYTSFVDKKYRIMGTSMAVQWPRLCALKLGGKLDPHMGRVCLKGC